MTIRVPISIPSHVVIADIYNYLPPLSFHIPFVLSKHLAGSLPVGVTYTFIPDGSVALVILPKFTSSCYSFSLTLITKQRPLRDTKGSPVT